jgi:HEPN domain-containing protein
LTPSEAYTQKEAETAIQSAQTILDAVQIYLN